MRPVARVRQAHGAQRLAQLAYVRQLRLRDTERGPALGGVERVGARLQVEGVHQRLHQGEAIGCGRALTHGSDGTSVFRLRCYPLWGSMQ